MSRAHDTGTVTRVTSEDLTRVTSKSVFAFADLFRGRLRGPRILIYHQVADDPVNQMAVSPGTLSRQLDWIESSGRVVSLDALTDGADHDSDYVLTFDDGYEGVYRHAFPLLKERGMPFTLYLTTGLVGSARDDAEPGLEPLDWDQVAEMVSSGLVTVGAHTHTHPDMRTIPETRVEEELDVSNRIIEERTGLAPRHFAYPKGYWAEAAEPHIRLRYETAVLGAGPEIGPKMDPFRLTRLPVQRADGYFFFRRKMERGLRLEEWVRARLKGYRNPGADSRGRQRAHA